MRSYFIEKPLTTDQITSVTVDGTLPEKDWKLVRVAVSQGLLHANVGLGNPDEMPWREGTFHLAYTLAPHFLLFPRRGKAAKLAAIQEFHAMTQKEREAFMKYGQEQLRLFDEGDKS